MSLFFRFLISISFPYLLQKITTASQICCKFFYRKSFKKASLSPILQLNPFIVYLDILYSINNTSDSHLASKDSKEKFKHIKQLKSKHTFNLISIDI